MQWLQEYLNLAKRSQAQLARHLKIAPPRISEMVKGERKLQQQEIKPTADFLGISLELINALIMDDAAGVDNAKKGLSEAPAPAPAPSYPLAQMTSERRSGPADIPVWASAQAGDDGAIILVPDPVDYVRRSERMQGVKNPFAFLVIGESMSPALEHGDQVVINPALLPRSGVDCVFVHQQPDGTFLALIKRLLRSNADSWRVRQFCPSRDFDLSKKKWPRAHVVAEIRRGGL